MNAELERRLIYSVIVAGKSAVFTNDVVGRLQKELSDYRTDSLFEALRWQVENNRIGALLRRVRAGNYRKLERCIRELVVSNLNLATCTIEELERIHGIGPKTSRFFILWTRPGAQYAALDVHILRWLRSKGYSAPKSTPSGCKYRELEVIFLAEAEKLKITPRELDEQIWAEGSRKTKS